MYMLTSELSPRTMRRCRAAGEGKVTCDVWMSEQGEKVAPKPMRYRTSCPAAAAVHPASPVPGDVPAAAETARLSTTNDPLEIYLYDTPVRYSLH